MDEEASDSCHPFQDVLVQTDHADHDSDVYRMKRCDRSLYDTSPSPASPVPASNLIFFHFPLPFPLLALQTHSIPPLPLIIVQVRRTLSIRETWRRDIVCWAAETPTAYR